MSYGQSEGEKKISKESEFDFDDSGFADAYERDTSSTSLPQLPSAEDPIGILPGITQFLSQQFKTILGPPEPKEAPEIIEAAGFRSEVHKVTTEDGYILTMHRVGDGVGPVVFLQHGLICSSVDWVLGARDKALGFILADAGYDVWMGNFRGNAYSREHTVLDPDREKFWHFSFDQMGQHDLPKMLNYVLELTRQEKLTYIGHSMGTMAFWVMMNNWPRMNAKVRLMVGLAPVTAPNLHRNSPLHPLATHSQRVKIIQRRWLKFNSLSSCAGCSATQTQIQIQIQITQILWLKFNSLSSCAGCSATQATMSSWQKAPSSPTSSKASGAR